MYSTQYTDSTPINTNNALYQLKAENPSYHAVICKMECWVKKELDKYKIMKHLKSADEKL